MITFQSIETVESLTSVTYLSLVKKILAWMQSKVRPEKYLMNCNLSYAGESLLMTISES